MIFNVGDRVYWTIQSGKTITERAGIVVTQVPSGIHPNNVGFGVIASPTYQTRDFVTYLVKTPDMVYMVDHPVALPKEKEGLLLEQKASTVRREMPIDRRDRERIKELAVLLGDDFMENEDSLCVPNWGKRFCFVIEDGVEYVNRVRLL